MGYRTRIFFTDRQTAEVWDRWHCGESMSLIGRFFERGSSSIYPLLERTGGIRPPARTRARLALTLAEREEISRGPVAEHSLRSIARRLKRASSTISREVKRNRGARCYRAATRLTLRPGSVRIAPNPASSLATTISAGQYPPRCTATGPRNKWQAG